MRIVISTQAKLMRSGKENPKNYPYWKSLVEMLKINGHDIVQVLYGVEKEIPECNQHVHYESLKVVEKLIDSCELYISVDNFLPHLAHYRKKYGIVLWGKSNPDVFGYAENINLLKDRKFLRNHQFETWEAEEYDPNVFVEPQIVVEAVKKFEV